MFKSVRGRSVHEQRAHRNWYDERQADGICNKKAPWSTEELVLLARQEAKLTLDGVKFINQALVPFFPSRTLESIKGQRRAPNHKSKVLQLIAEMVEGSEKPEPSATNITMPSEVRRTDLKTLVSKLFATLQPISKSDFHADKLDLICKNVCTWSTARLFDELKAYLLLAFPPTTRTCKRPPRCLQISPPTKRQARRADYALTQRAWTKNQCNCLKTILKSMAQVSPPTKTCMVQYWRTLFTESSKVTPGDSPKRSELSQVWRPIEPDEVRASFPNINTCPGPDGLTARQLKAVPLSILTRIFNLFMVSGKLPEHLLKGRTTLIPKKDEAQHPEDYRPITVQSIMTRAYHKILAKRLAESIDLDHRQKAFLPKDGCAINVFEIDLILKYHRQNFKPLYMMSMDVAKAFDSVSHETVKDTLTAMGVPPPMIEYIMYTYENGSTTLKCGDWESDAIKPTRGVKQGDPLSPMIFNMIVDRLLRLLPPEVGVNVGQVKFTASAFADDLVFMASTPIGLQHTIDIASKFLSKCGLNINAAKSFTISIRNVPHVKKSIIDGKIKFTCFGKELPALKREDEWKYLGIPFSAEGRTTVHPEKQLEEALYKLTKAPLKPQQRLFGLRVMVLPGLYHLLTLGFTTLSRLRKIDTMTRAAARKWLSLPHDTPNAFFHADVRDGGLSIPSMRWLMPLHRRVRLKNLIQDFQTVDPYLTREIQATTRRLTENRSTIETAEQLKKRWAQILHATIDGRCLKESNRIPCQHRWVTDGSRLLSGKDFINMIKLRINAMPTRSRTSRGRGANRSCRAGCQAVETLNHILQQCHRTHRARIDRHNAVVSYIKRALTTKSEMIEEEPRFTTPGGLRKPDLIAVDGEKALVVDAQIVGEQLDLCTAHQSKIVKYEPLEAAIKEKYAVKSVIFTSATLSWRGIWSAKSARSLNKILTNGDLKILSTRVLLGGLNAFWKFNRTTSTYNKILKNRTGIG